MLLFDIMRNIIFVPLSLILDYDVIEEDEVLKEEKENGIHHNYEIQLAT